MKMTLKQSEIKSKIVCFSDGKIILGKPHSSEQRGLFFGYIFQQTAKNVGAGKQSNTLCVAK